MIKRFALAGALLLSACTTVVENNSRKVDKMAAARDRTAIAAEYIRKGENDKALSYLQQALKSNPDSADAHNLMGVVMERDGNVKAAGKAFRKALSLRDDFTQAHNNYGSFLFRQKEYKQALKQFEAAAADASYGYRASAFEGVGRCAWMLGDRARAEEAFSRSLSLEPNLPTATLYIAEIRYDQNNPESARSLYKRYLELTPNSPQTAQSLWLGIRLERRYGNQDALASYELALKRLYPESREYKLYLTSLNSGK